MIARQLTGIREWLGGKLVILVLVTISRLPARAAKGLASMLGKILQRLMRRRRRIVTANLNACFPEWSHQQRRQLEAELFQSMGLSIYEMALAWCRQDSQQLPACQITGLEHVEQARQRGRGVLLVNGHFNCLEICSRYLAEAMPLLGVYRPLDNQVLERFHTNARLRYAQGMISKRDPKQIMRALQQGQIIWFAPDQDFGPQRSIFIPFFKRPAATLTATWRLARRASASVLIATPKRLADGGYQITIGPPLPGVDADSAEQLLTELNRSIEEAVRAAPADYWWFHRRFKTTPPGEKSIYSESS